MKILSYLQRFNWRLLLVFVLVAAIVHIVQTFRAVDDRRDSAYARLQQELPHNVMTLARPVTPENQALPFLSPEAYYAFCPFETNLAPLRVRAAAGGTRVPGVHWIPRRPGCVRATGRDPRRRTRSASCRRGSAGLR